MNAARHRRGPAEFADILAKAVVAALLTPAAAIVAVDNFGFEQSFELYAGIAAVAAFLSALLVPDFWSGGAGKPVVDERKGGLAVAWDATD